jgi:multimeric flavodoxin WrbA
MKALILSSSPRREGNSAALAGAVAAGLAEAGHAAETVHLADAIDGFLRDCRQCRAEPPTSDAVRCQLSPCAACEAVSSTTDTGQAKRPIGFAHRSAWAARPACRR